MDLFQKTPAQLLNTSPIPAGPGLRLATAVRLFLGGAWALALGLAGVWLWQHQISAASTLRLPRPAEVGRMVAWASIGFQAASLFLFMFMVADTLCPRASRRIILPMQLLMAHVATLALINALWLGHGLLS